MNEQSGNRGGASAPNIDGASRLLGVFGWPVKHSLSPVMHNAALTYLNLPLVYVPFEVAPENLETALRSLPALGIVGVNLTIPHKERALMLVDEATARAQEVGAVNTVHVVDGRLIGDNTDGEGFGRSLAETGLNMAQRTAVVLGAGGAARSVVFQLLRMQCPEIVIANRTRERAQDLADAAVAAGFPQGIVRAIGWDDDAELSDSIRRCGLLAQTTRVGMHPDTDAMPPVSEQSLHVDLLVYDLIYNPAETRLMNLARRRGCRTLNGAKMLVYQGAAAFERWLGRTPPVDIMERAITERLLR